MAIRDSLEYEHPLKEVRTRDTHFHPAL